MNLWQKTATAILRLVMASVLVLSLTSCGEKAVSQEPSGSLQPKAQLSKQISEVSPPATIQELRSALEVYQPQVTIVTPKQDEILEDDTVTVRFQVKDLPIYKDPKLELGPHLQVILDNQPLIAVYNLNNPLVLPDLSPGTHTLRVFASRPWDESFKNEGAYAQTTFHVVTKTDDNNPDPAKPLLTYSHPKGSYGAEPILLDFYLTNAPLHLVATENPDDDIADWRIRCTINDESFVLDRWQAVYLKGFKPGKNWVKLEFLDEQGNPVKNVFNTTVRLITYEPNGKDTLSKIVRGELSVDQVRSIVDPNYTAKIPTAEPAPTPTSTPSVEETPQTQPKQETQPVPEPTPTPTLTPSVEKTPQTQLKEEKQPVPESGSVPQTQPEKPKSGDFFNRFERRTDKIPTPEATVEPTPGLSPTFPEVIETPQPEPELTPVPEKVTQDPEKKSRFSRYFNRQPDKKPTPEAPVETTPGLPPTLPEIIESPAPESMVPQPEITAEPKSEVTPTPEKQTEEIQKAHSNSEQ
ncbi:hypothetical protein [Brasilonema bromeliae]|uniref:FHA domain containing protein n=1 Tax=Brasilonema bromeliae SPC951 TaxID=385972 RepID=A0ABX1P7M1_9CYAN|nr:hypothetical protein [Brasilonema bromeliae]NMG20394.1 hypothetical protein [Brasilonema bromeliae SPC951]